MNVSLYLFFAEKQQLGMTGGIFIASLLGFGFVTYVPHGWQYIQVILIFWCFFIVCACIIIAILYSIQQAIGCFPAILLLLFQNYLPESPKWLLTQGYMAQDSSGIVVNVLHSQTENVEMMNVQKEPSRNDNKDSTTPANSDIDLAMTKNTTDPNQARNIKDNKMIPHVAALLRTLRPVDYDIDNEIGNLLVAAFAQSLSQINGAEATWNDVFAYKKGVLVGVGLMIFRVSNVCVCFKLSPERG